jgi:hypothetical protein
MLAAGVSRVPAIDIRATSPLEAAALSEFLRRMFRLRAGSSSLAGTHMRWKYWSAHPDWSGSRSFTARHRGEIVAHAAAWPVRVRVPGQIVPAVHVIDGRRPRIPQEPASGSCGKSEARCA